jgi:transketolase
MTPTHDSIRGWFAAALHDEMQKDDKIWLIVADLGYGMFDQIRDNFPQRFVNCGASEQLAVGVGIGLALSGKKPFVYSITTFLLFRAFEWHRNYINHENIPVRLVGSGIDKDYAHDGISHQPSIPEIDKCFGMFPHITVHIPTDKFMIPGIVTRMTEYEHASFICLRR